MKYTIKQELHTYTYRSYMACEDNGPDDMKATGAKYVVYRGNCKLKAHSSLENAEAHVKRLETNRKVKERSNES